MTDLRSRKTKLMPKTAKNRATALAKADLTKRYTVDEAVSLVKSVAYAKFDESVDVAVRLGVNPKHADQMVRGAIVLPKTDQLGGAPLGASA